MESMPGIADVYVPTSAWDAHSTPLSVGDTVLVNAKETTLGRSRWRVTEIVSALGSASSVGEKHRPGLKASVAEAQKQASERLQPGSETSAQLRGNVAASTGKVGYYAAKISIQKASATAPAASDSDQELMSRMRAAVQDGSLGPKLNPNHALFDPVLKAAWKGLSKESKLALRVANTATDKKSDGGDVTGADVTGGGDTGVEDDKAALGSAVEGGLEREEHRCEVAGEEGGGAEEGGAAGDRGATWEERGGEGEEEGALAGAVHGAVSTSGAASEAAAAVDEGEAAEQRAEHEVGGRDAAEEAEAEEEGEEEVLECVVQLLASEGGALSPAELIKHLFEQRPGAKKVVKAAGGLVAYCE
eukprot:420109-Rhodomonas_salina.1